MLFTKRLKWLKGSSICISHAAVIMTPTANNQGFPIPVGIQPWVPSKKKTTHTHTHTHAQHKTNKTGLSHRNWSDGRAVGLLPCDKLLTGHGQFLLEARRSFWQIKRGLKKHLLYSEIVPSKHSAYSTTAPRLLQNKDKDREQYPWVTW